MNPVPAKKKKTTTDALLIRMSEVERRFLDAAAALKTEQLAKEIPGSSIAAGTILRGGGLRLAGEILGMTLEQFEKSKKG